MGLEKIMKCSLSKYHMSRKDMFFKEFPWLGIALASAIVIAATINDVTFPVTIGTGFDSMHVPAGSAMCISRREEIKFLNERFYEFPAWVAALYVMAYNIYFAEYAGFLHNPYVTALVRSLSVLAILPLTPWSFYGPLVTCGAIYTGFAMMNTIPPMEPISGFFDHSVGRSLDLCLPSHVLPSEQRFGPSEDTFRIQ